MNPRAVPRSPAVLGGLVAALLAATTAQASTLDARSIHERVFPSGLRLVVKPSHSLALASVQVWIRVGSYREALETSGYAHIIEHLMFKGGEGRAAGDLDQQIEDLGGVLSATTEKDWTMFAATVASRDAGRVIQLMGNGLRTARFQADDYRLERGVLIDEIERSVADPVRALTQILYQEAFARHPYRLDARGSVRTINSVRLDDVRAWYERYYRPANISVIVVGDVELDAIARQVQAAFAADQPSAGAPEPLPEPEMAGGEAKRRELEVPLAGAYVGLAFPAPSVADRDDIYAMDLLLTLLEQGDFGRLPVALRGRVSALKATFETRRQPGLLTVVAMTDAPNAPQVEETIRNEIRRLSDETIPEAELAATKQVLAGSYALDNETYTGQANTLGYYEAIDNWQFATTYMAKVHAVTIDEMRAVARKYLRLDRCCTVVLRPRPAPPDGVAPSASPRATVSLPEAVP